jgi:hypothetical protein
VAAKPSPSPVPAVDVGIQETSRIYKRAVSFFDSRTRCAPPSFTSNLAPGFFLFFLGMLNPSLLLESVFTPPKRPTTGTRLPSQPASQPAAIGDCMRSMSQTRMYDREVEAWRGHRHRHRHRHRQRKRKRKRNIASLSVYFSFHLFCLTEKLDL